MKNSVAPRLAAAFVAEALVLSFLLIVALDLYAHKQVDPFASLNIWGYRGPVAHLRQPHEIRVMVVGGTRAFGFGMAASWTTATVLRQKIMLVTDRPGGEVRPIVALNVARLGALADSYAETIRRFAYLQPDYICLYDDLGVGGGPLPQDRSGVFALTGYVPALPLVLAEKGMAWRYGDVALGYGPGTRDERPRPPWWRRIGGAGLERVGASAASLDRALARAVSPRHDSWEGASNPSVYATTIIDAIDVAFRHAHGVVLAVSPVETSSQAANLAALRIRLDPRLASTRQLRFVNLGAEPSLSERALRLDDWNYGGEATATAAGAMAPAVLDLIGQRDR